MAPPDSEQPSSAEQFSTREIVETIKRLRPRLLRTEEAQIGHGRTADARYQVIVWDDPLPEGELILIDKFQAPIETHAGHFVSLCERYELQADGTLRQSLSPDADLLLFPELRGSVDTRAQDAVKSVLAAAREEFGESLLDEPSTFDMAVWQWKRIAQFVSELPDHPVTNEYFDAIDPADYVDRADLRSLLINANMLFMQDVEHPRLLEQMEVLGTKLQALSRQDREVTALGLNALSPAEWHQRVTEFLESDEFSLD